VVRGQGIRHENERTYEEGVEVLNQD